MVDVSNQHLLAPVYVMDFLRLTLVWGSDLLHWTNIFKKDEKLCRIPGASKSLPFEACCDLDVDPEASCTLRVEQATFLGGCG